MSPISSGSSAPKQTKKKRNQQGRLQAQRVMIRWWRTPLALGGGAIGFIAIVLIVILIINHLAPSGTSDVYNPVPSNVLSAITHPNASVLATIGNDNNSQPANLKRTPDSILTLKDSSGKVIVVYVGAEFCPYCAAERWSIVLALSRFGTFHGLQEMQSAGAPEFYPDTSTFTFLKSSYSSESIDFQPNEIEDRAHQPLQKLSAQDTHVYETYDWPPYVPQPTATENFDGGFPFVDIGSRFVVNGPGYDPQVLQGLSWDQIASGLSDANNPATQAIVGHANALTTAMCVAIDNADTRVCSSPGITNLEATLNQVTPVAPAISTPTP